MSVKEQYGNLVVRSFVADASGSEVDTIAIGSNSDTTRHIVEVENWSTIPYDVLVKVVLPQGTRRLSFSGAADNWEADISSLAENETEQAEESISASGSTAGKERVHCTAVKWKKAKRHRWTHATNGLPLCLFVTVE